MANNLAQRAQQSVAQQQAGGQPTLQQLIRQMQPEIAKALPRHMNPERMARIATTVLKQTPALARCTPESFLGALLTASQLGLEPGPLGEAYLVPYGREVTFIPGYKGLIKLAWQSGALQDIHAQVVYEHDEFDYQLGLRRDLVHKPATGDRGVPVYVYAVAVFKEGGFAFEVMSIPEVEAIRARSRAGRNGPWVSDWAAMAKKTAVKQLAKWLPMSTELNQASALDETQRDGTDAHAADIVDVVPQMPAEIEGPPVVDADEVAPVEEGAGSKKATKAQRDAVQRRFDDEKLPDDMIPDALTSWTGREVSSLEDLTTDDITAIDAAFAQRDQAAAAVDNEGK